MLQKIVSLVLVCFLVNSISAAPVAAGMQATKEEELVRKVKAKVMKLGTGAKARVEVKLKDGSKLKGYVSKINDAHFLVKDKQTGSVTTISYEQVKQVKAPYEKAFSDPKVWLGIALLPAIIILSIWTKSR